MVNITTYHHHISFDVLPRQFWEGGLYPALLLQFFSVYQNETVDSFVLNKVKQ